MSKEVMRPFGKRDKIGYFLGDFSNALFFGMTANYLTMFYVDVLGIAAASVGILLLVARMWDAVNDPIIGGFIDTRKRTPAGKFRPWVLRMGFPVVIFGVLSFFIPTGLLEAPVHVKLMWAYITYIGFGMSYTAINIPYGAMVSVMTDNATERASLSMYRSYGSVFAMLLSSTLVPMFVFDKVTREPIAENFLIIALIMAVLSLLGWFACYRMTRERIQPKVETKEKMDLKLVFTGIMKNRSLIALLISGFLFLMQFLTVGTITPYLFKDYFKDTSLLPIVGLISIIPMFIIGPMLKPLMIKYGKKPIAVIGCFFASAMGFLIVLLPSINVTTYVVLLFFMTLGYTFMNILTWAFVADAIDYHEYVTHKRAEGIIYAIYSFSRKMGQAGAGWVGANILIVTGYVAKAPQQSQETANMIKNFAGLVPGVLSLLVALIMLFVYDLTQAKLTHVINELKERRAKDGTH